MWWKGVKIGGDSECSAASIGYSRRIRKRLIHSRRHTAVTESVSSNKNLAAWLLARGRRGCPRSRKAAVETAEPRSRPHRMRRQAPNRADFLGRPDSV